MSVYFEMAQMADEAADEIESLRLQLASARMALEFIADDECVEVTPDAVRIRKVELNAVDREKVRARNRRG